MTGKINLTGDCQFIENIKRRAGGYIEIHISKKKTWTLSVALDNYKISVPQGLTLHLCKSANKVHSST